MIQWSELRRGLLNDGFQLFLIYIFLWSWSEQSWKSTVWRSCHQVRKQRFNFPLSYSHCIQIGIYCFFIAKDLPVAALVLGGRHGPYYLSVYSFPKQNTWKLDNLMLHEPHMLWMTKYTWVDTEETLPSLWDNIKTVISIITKDLTGKLLKRCNKQWNIALPKKSLDPQLALSGVTSLNRMKLLQCTSAKGSGHALNYCLLFLMMSQ